MSETIEVNEQVRSLMADVFQVPLLEINPDLTFGDLPQWDSLGHMELMMRLEEQFQVEVTTDTIAELTSLSAICDYIQGKNHAHL